MRYVARVSKVLHPEIHSIGTIEDGRVVRVAGMPLPTRVEIHLDGSPDEPCMMFRYDDDNAFCGDTWHQNLSEAFADAEYEYGITEDDFSPMDDVA